jgi:class 3 adenylate cyclase
MLSKDSYLFTDSSDDAYNQEMYSVLVEQPPPPDRVNKSFTNKHDYVPQSTNGNPFWFQDVPSGAQTEEDYYEFYTEKELVNGSTTPNASIDQAYAPKTDAYETNNSYAETPYIGETEGNSIPTGDLTIVCIDIQGSESLREELPHDWIEAHDVYDIIIRRSYADYDGYEISSRGSPFNLAFQDPVDALALALEVQVKLYNYDSWPAGILKYPDAKDEPALKFKGIRAKIGMHCGLVDIQADALTGEQVYVGDAVEVAKEVGSLCHGGQILITSETWNATTGRCQGRPQVMDCGEHFLFEAQCISGQTKKVCKHLLQLVPYGMAFNFGAVRGRIESKTSEVTIKNASSAYGRLFPPVPSKKQLSTSFLNALFCCALFKQLE